MESQDAEDVNTKMKEPENTEWETIWTPETNYLVNTKRMKVPGGWIYKQDEWGENIDDVMSMVFVPTPKVRLWSEDEAHPSEEK